MNDENKTPDADDMVEVDLDHPWVDASTAMAPMPTPSFVKVEPSSIEIAEGKMANAALFTAVGPNGVFTVFVPPQALYQLVQQAGAIFQLWENEKSKGLIVAGKNEQKEAQRLADMQAAAQKIMRS